VISFFRTRFNRHQKFLISCHDPSNVVDWLFTNVEDCAESRVVERNKTPGKAEVAAETVPFVSDWTSSQELETPEQSANVTAGKTWTNQT
jgi:hypothetical protein